MRDLYYIYYAGDFVLRVNNFDMMQLASLYFIHVNKKTEEDYMNLHIEKFSWYDRIFNYIANIINDKRDIKAWDTRYIKTRYAYMLYSDKQKKFCCTKSRGVHKDYN